MSVHKTKLAGTRAWLQPNSLLSATLGLALLTLGGVTYLCHKGHLRASQTGLIWDATLDENGVDGSFFACGETIFCIGYTDTPNPPGTQPTPVKLYALDAASGQTRWKRELQESSMATHKIGGQSLMIGAGTIGLCTLDGVFHMAR